MLNGLDPIIIFHFYNKGKIDPLTGPTLLQSIGALIGIPIPIYLSEKLTGIYIDDESRGIDVSTTVDSVTDSDVTGTGRADPVVSQRAVDSTVTINLFALKDSIMLTALSALAEMIIKRLQSQEYGISYLNGPTVIFNGLLHRFSTSTGANDNLIRIEMVLSNAKKQLPTPKPGITPIPNTGGTSLGPNVA